MNELETRSDDKLTQKKNQMLQQFKSWLDQLNVLPEELPELQKNESLVDLYSLFAEFAALKSEIKIESRQFKNAFEQFELALNFLKTGYTFQKETGTGQKSEAEMRELILLSILPDILTIRDRILDGLEILAQLNPKMFRKKRKYQRKKQIIERLKEGQSMLLHRMDKFLQSNGVSQIPAQGKVFDPHLMNAVASARIPDMPDAIVVEELRPGFLIGEKLLRLAEVKVNKV